MAYITCKQVPEIPKYLEPDQYHLVVPLEEFKDIITNLEIDNTDKEAPALIVNFNTNVIEGLQDKLIIPCTLLNSKKADVQTPEFLFENSTPNKGMTPKPYFNLDGFRDERVLNMPQMVYMVIQHRLNFLKNQILMNRKIYLDLLVNVDFGLLKTYIEYERPVAVNTQRKIENTYVILNYYQHNGLNKPIGESLKTNGFREDEWVLVMRDLAPHLRCTSESSFSEKCKVVLSPDKTKSVFRAPAFEMNHLGGKSIFPFASNIVARLKTHVLGEAYNIIDSDHSPFKHDIFFKDGHKLKFDETNKLALVVFHPMNNTTLSFVAGEMEASPRIASTQLKEKKHYNVTVKSEKDLRVKVGQNYICTNGRYDLTQGKIINPDTNEEIDNTNTIYNIVSFTVTNIVPLSCSDYKITVEQIMKAGNARIISKTGLKAVTHIFGKNRYVYIAPKDQSVNDLPDCDAKETIIEMRQRKLSPYSVKDSSLTFEEHVKINGELEQINSCSYKTVDPKELKGWTKHSVDLVCGMNAVKANINTIRLAQALLAVKLGFYTPKPKGSQVKYEGVLDASNEQEINLAANSLPDFVYLGDDNVPQKCHIGLVPINFTELGTTHVKFKPQSFSFEAGNVIKKAMPKLFDHIFNNYLDEEKKDACLELYEIYEDSYCKLGIKKQLPIYNLKDIKSKFSSSDLILKTSSSTIIDSILFNESFNPDGFIIDVRAPANKSRVKVKPCLIRIPSAKTLSYFQSRRLDGDFMYDKLLLAISRIFVPLLGYLTPQDAEEGNKFDENYSIPFHYIFSQVNLLNEDAVKNAQANGKRIRSTHLGRYRDTLKGTVYSSAESSKYLTQSLIKPKIPGVSLKQTVHSLVPNDCVVMLNDHLIKCSYTQSGHTALLDKSSYEYDVITRAIEANDNFERNEIKDELFKVFDDLPLGILNRNPFLWSSQMLLRKVMGKREFSAYLNIVHNIKLDSLLHPFYNKDVLFMNPATALLAKSDVDGDLAPLMILDPIGQVMLKELVNIDLDICVEEKNWLTNYARKEYGSNTKLLLDFDKNDPKFQYKIHSIPTKYVMVNNKHLRTFAKFLINAGIAKTAVGPATVDSWNIKSVLQAYEALYKKHKGVYLAPNSQQKIPMVDYFSPDLRTKIEFVYVCIVQERVVEGIKHLEGGSSGFGIYYLNNITDKTHEKEIKKQLTQNYWLTTQEVERFLAILNFVKGLDGLLGASVNFIKKYNKGKLPTPTKSNPNVVEELQKHEQLLMECTYFGTLVKPLYLISQQVKALDDFTIESLRKQSSSLDNNSSVESKSELFDDVEDM